MLNTLCIVFKKIFKTLNCYKQCILKAFFYLKWVIFSAITWQEQATF